MAQWLRSLVVFPEVQGFNSQHPQGISHSLAPIPRVLTLPSGLLRYQEWKWHMQVNTYTHKLQLIKTTCRAGMFTWIRYLKTIFLGSLNIFKEHSYYQQDTKIGSLPGKRTHGIGISWAFTTYLYAQKWTLPTWSPWNLLIHFPLRGSPKLQGSLISGKVSFIYTILHLCGKNIILDLPSNIICFKY